MSRCLNTSHISHCENKTPRLSRITEHRLSAPQKTSLEEEEESIIMNKILALCIGLLIITLPFSSQQGSNSGEDKRANSTSVQENKPSETNAAGLGPLPTALCLLIPAATLGFIQSRS